jgi:2-polyprenyl-3-methyl-5-hydroxy-6-metoxy-1,4-benzoquinol methylase
MLNYDFFNPNPYGIHMKALNLVGKNKRVLEVGSATGQISRRLAEKGCEVIGIEVNEDCAEIAKKYCDDLLVCDIETIENLPYDDFDFILLLDVLEHLRSPLATLKKLKAYLNEGGSVIVSLPNMANWRVRWDLLFGRFEYSERGILDKTHLRFFNEKSAKDLLQHAGFDIIEFDVVPTVHIIHVRDSFAYAIAKMRANFFASQFLMVGRVKSD